MNRHGRIRLVGMAGLLCIGLASMAWLVAAENQPAAQNAQGSEAGLATGPGRGESAAEQGAAHDAAAQRGAAYEAVAEKRAGQILAATGVRGGLIVHLGCGDGRLTAALHAGDAFLVQGLERDGRQVEAARQYIQSRGLYGPVSVRRWSGRRLPYVDNLVNLLVGEDTRGVPPDEIQRVLVPGGVAWLKTADGWSRVVKPPRQGADQWSHYLHDASNNAVAHDVLVGPPRHLQWVGGPTWTRHHEHMSSLTAMVSAGGRLFYIVDEGLRAEIQLPPQWNLVARDAHNGTVLWRRALASWHTPLWFAKSGPAQLPRRLVATPQTVFVTMGLTDPVTALDAATGRTIRTYQATRATEEILHIDGMLLALVNEHPTGHPWLTKAVHRTYRELLEEPERWAWQGGERSIVALEPSTGRVLWTYRSPVVPLTLAADQTRVYFHDGQRVVCLNRTDGSKLWSSAPLPRAPQIRSWFAPTLVVYDDVVLFAGAEKMRRHRGGHDTMTALSARTGELLWTAEHPPSGYDSPEDLLVIGGLVWTAATTNRRDPGEFVGRDVHTGQIKRRFASDCGQHMPHHRCHRAKATDRYILASRTGIECVDLSAEHWDRNDWVRGACLYGLMPANGLIYAPPHSCACYILAKLNGLNALAARRQTPAASRQPPGPKHNADSRLEPGPAYETGPPDPKAASSTPKAGPRKITEKGESQLQIDNLQFAISNLTSPARPSTLDPQPRPPNVQPSDWPTYRHDAARSGRTPAAVPVHLKLDWQTHLGGPLSPPVIAHGLVMVAAVDRHTVHALELATGRKRWSYTAGGRVDSPPTVWRGRVLFGCADGWVYCLRAADGRLCWRFRAAPQELSLVAFNQLESVWPVHGSVLVHDGVVHCVAGRSMFLDGGLRYLRLDAATGKLLSETVLDNRDPKTGRPLDAAVQWPNLPVALPDILSCDGTNVYMRTQPFDLEGHRRAIIVPTDYTDQTGPGAHLFSPTGFLDDSWWHRTYWVWGKTFLGGAGAWYAAAYRAPAGRVLVFDQSRVYGFGRRPQYFPRTDALEYHLFACSKEPPLVGPGVPPERRRQKRPRRPRRAVYAPKPSRPQYQWTHTVPVLGRALVLAGDTLFLAGPPDVVDQEATLLALDAKQTRQQLADQAAAYQGRRGAVLLALTADDGTKRAAWKLESPPVFDGMAATTGRLVMATMDGRIVCLSGSGRRPLPAAEVELGQTPLGLAGSRQPVALTAHHPDFQHLTQVLVSNCALGWRLRTPSGKVGFALRRLPKPLTGRVRFKLRAVLIPNPWGSPSTPPPGNAFLAFGDRPDDEHLVKCGVRSAGQAASIVYGPLLAGKVVRKPAEVKVNQPTDMTVTVDLTTGRVTLSVSGQTVQATLPRPPESIRYVGYCVHSVASEFAPLQIKAQ